MTNQQHQRRTHIIVLSLWPRSESESIVADLSSKALASVEVVTLWFWIVPACTSAQILTNSATKNSL